ncbi:hypothetical protein GQS40_13705|uniref:Uncharacterized protein n=1 Tax=Leuconostoc lactis TaxID=1246 RepID=A0A6L7AC07_LEULA|nr:hypothetical protein [Leuconostoc lactis]
MQQATAVAADHQYSAFRGEMRFKTAIAQFYFDTYGVVLDPATEVAVLAGSKIHSRRKDSTWPNSGVS